MIQIITKRACGNIRFRTYRFSNIEKARAFISRFNLENKIIDIIIN